MLTWLRVIECMRCVDLGIRAKMSHASEHMNNLPSSLSFLCKLSIRGEPFLNVSKLPFMECSNAPVSQGTHFGIGHPAALHT